jgi:hypothetical protein
MRVGFGEVSTGLVDVTVLSLDELRTSDDPVLVDALQLLAGRTQCSQTGVLQNQVREEI